MALLSFEQSVSVIFLYIEYLKGRDDIILRSVSHLGSDSAMLVARWKTRTVSSFRSSNTDPRRSVIWTTSAAPPQAFQISLSGFTPIRFPRCSSETTLDNAYLHPIDPHLNKSRESNAPSHALPIETLSALYSAFDYTSHLSRVCARAIAIMSGLDGDGNDIFHALGSSWTRCPGIV